MKNSQQVVHSPELPSGTREIAASTSTPAPGSPRPATPGQYSFEEAMRLQNDLTRYVFHHKEAHGCEPTEFPPEFHIPVDVRPLVIHGEDIKTAQDVADGIITHMALYVHNRITLNQDTSDSNPEAAKTEVPDTANKVLETATG